MRFPYKRPFKKNPPDLVERKAIARQYIKQGYCKTLVLRVCQVCSSSYYCKPSLQKIKKDKGVSIKRGRPYPGYSESIYGKKVSDEKLIKILKSYRDKQEFHNWGGYKVLSRYLLRDYGVRANKKKVYRLCCQEIY